MAGDADTDCWDGLHSVGDTRIVAVSVSAALGRSCGSDGRMAPECLPSAMSW